MIRECQMTDNGMRCEDDGELCVSIINVDRWLCWEHFQVMEAPNLKIIRRKISQEQWTTNPAVIIDQELCDRALGKVKE